MTRVVLFDRPGRQIRLNRYGRAFLERVDEAFFALEEGQRQVRSMADMEQGEIALAAEGLHWLPDIVHDFRAEQPTARFRLVQRSLPEMRHELEIGAIDFAFTALA